MLPLFAHYFDAKLGSRRLLKYSICLGAYIPPSIPHNLYAQGQHTQMTATVFWKNSSFCTCAVEHYGSVFQSSLMLYTDRN